MNFQKQGWSNQRRQCRRGRLALLLCVAALSSGRTVSALPPVPQPQSGPFVTPITVGSVDEAALAEWEGGSERPAANAAALRDCVWTQTTASGGGTVSFGVSSQSGPRHLRIGFKGPVLVGSVLVRGGDQLSVLRPDAPYPGNMADESQWTPAERAEDHTIVAAGPSAPMVDGNTYALWTLPPNTRTRALRFTHIAEVTDSNFAGTLAGVYIFSARFEDVAQGATITTSANSSAAELLVDGKYHSWKSWDNGPNYRHAVSETNPEWITLTWPKPVAVSGLLALWAGFNAADTEVFAGPDSRNPQEAPESDWHPVGAKYSLRNQYPRQLGIDFLDFGKTVMTRAVRLRITQVTNESQHPHLQGKTQNGMRVWLGQLLALTSLANGNLEAALVAAPASALPHPPIAVHFTLPVAGYVTLAIDDSEGNRVRNLISDTFFEKGLHTVWWDGSDDLGRNRDAANHGVYLIPAHLVDPGSYQVHGLYHTAIDLHYEMTVYNAGDPPWQTPDGKGFWLTNHTPPSATLFVPAQKAPGGKPLVYLGSYISEGGAGLAWVDLDGHKQGGRGWIGGAWTAAPYLARDQGTQSDPAVFAYVASVWLADKADRYSSHLTVHLTGLTARNDKPILNFPFEARTVDHNPDGTPSWVTQIAGLAVHDGVAVISLALQNQLLFVDALAGKPIGAASVESPHGLAFDSQGRLLVLSGNSLLRYTLPASAAALRPESLPKPERIVPGQLKQLDQSGEALHNPAGITVDAAGNIYISQQDGLAANSNQILVFSPEGKYLHSIGRPGPSKAGPYDPLHMNNPRGLSIDSNNHLWVAEEDFQPKRVSMWTLDGSLVKAFYGPSEYGGGGSLDPHDQTRFYYHGMEFHLDWATGKDTLASILYRPNLWGPDSLSLPATGAPSSVLYSNGHRYFMNSFLGHGTTGVPIGFLYLDKGGTLQLAAAMGRANDWPLLQSSAFESRLPAGAKLASHASQDSVLFTWSDVNENGRVDPEEVTFLKSSSGYLTVQSDGSSPIMLNSFVDGRALLYKPIKVTTSGIPVYDLNQSTVVADGTQTPASDGGGQVLYDPRETVLTTAPLPFAKEGVGGESSGGTRWSYPSLWPGLHPSHNAPVPDHSGELVGTTHLLGSFVTLANSDAGPLWAINNNFGSIYLFTADGLYVTQLFQDGRTGKPWSMPHAIRNMLLNEVSLEAENFFPSITQTADGNVYLVDGGLTSIVRVDGLSSLHRLPAATLQVTGADLAQAQAYFTSSERSRQSTAGPKVLDVPLHNGATPSLPEALQLLNAASWATIDSRITVIGWSGKPDLTEAAVTVAGDRLFAAVRCDDKSLLNNSGAIANAAFKTGGAIDLMIGTNPQADPKRSSPVAGDLRLLVYLVNGKPHATLYRPVVPGSKEPVPFSSPTRTVTFDWVDDVSTELQFEVADGTYVFSVPLHTLGLEPAADEHIKADIGVLRGNGLQTVQRIYWSNKATSITSDVPSEAELTPDLWGEWVFRPAE